MITFEALAEEYRMAVIDMYNYYVDRTTYAYPQSHVGYDIYDQLLDNARHMCGYVIRDETHEIIGFCQLKPFKPVQTFNETVEITYFLKPTHTGKGIGHLVLEKLMEDAKRLGKKHILASISGENEISLKFHAKHGFQECGRFKRIGYKLGREFDIVYMQKDI